MNYLGHAWVALARSDEPAFVLGAMLPDFAGMAGVRLLPQRDAGLRDGVALHLRTDGVFHDHPGFLHPVSQVTARLSARGVARGAARAVGHLGVELLLDGQLVQVAQVREAYMAALNAAPALPVDTADTSAAFRLERLLGRLRAYGAPWDYATPEGVTRRLFLALNGRPRLRPRAEDAEAIEAELRTTLPALRRDGPTLLAAVRAASHPPAASS